jgi:ergothioneine biosynthesis protein EgtC
VCRFVAYLGQETSLSSLVTEPAHSLIHQSYHSHERKEPLNGDGFGVTWYDRRISELPATLRDVSPAWNNQNLLSIASLVRSQCVFAHIRAATPGLPVTQLNCHPFSCGKFTFMHNGFISNFQKIRRSLLAKLSEASFNMIAGSTDSELLFAMFLDALKTQPSEDCESMGRALQQAIETVERVNRDAGCTDDSLLNLAVTDGYEMAVTRYITDGSDAANTLYHHQGQSYTCVDGVCQMSPAEDAADVVLIASEPLSNHSQWAQVRPNHLLLVDRSLGVRTVDM